MRILVVSDIFDRGGLETQIAGQVRNLTHQGVRMYLATGYSTPENTALASFNATITGLSLSPGATFQDLNRSLDRLDKFVKDNAITHIHTHPFYSSVLGALAAERAQIPFVMTLHGPVSLTSMAGGTLEVLFRTGALPSAQTVFCVSKETDLLCRSQASAKTRVLPNSVAIPDTLELSDDASDAWMWAGRIDGPKLAGLKQLIELMEDLGRELHVYGDGPARGELDEFLTTDSRRTFVSIYGWHEDVSSLMKSYTVVAGMGRVILEGAALDKSVLLVGYDGVKGFLDHSAMERAAFWNFSGRGFETIGKADIQDALTSLGGDQYRLRAWAQSNHAETMTWSAFTETLRPEFQSDPVLAAALKILSFKGESQDRVWGNSDFAEMLDGLLRHEGFDDRRDTALIQRMHDERQIALHDAVLNAERHKLAELHEEFARARSMFQEELARSGMQLEARHNEVVETARQLAEAVETRAAADIRNAELEEELAAESMKLAASGLRNAELQEELAARSMKLAAVDRARNDWEFRANAMEQSTSWRATWPLRVMSEGTKLVFDGTGGMSKRLRHIVDLQRSIGVSRTLQWMAQRLANGRGTRVIQTVISSQARLVRESFVEDRTNVVGRVGFYLSSLNVVGGLEIWVEHMASQFSERGYIPHLIFAGRPPETKAGKAFLDRFPFAVTFLEGGHDQLADVAAAAQLDALFVNHVYDGISDLPDNLVVIEILHNIYYWQNSSDVVDAARTRIVHFAAVAEPVMSYAIDYLSIPADKLSIIPHEIQREGLYRPYRSFLEKRKNSEEFRILSVANFYPQKNLICLIEAFAQLDAPNAKLVLVGEPADKDYFFKMTQTIERYGLKEKVELAGALNRKDVSRELSRADMFAFPSLYEGFGLSALEAAYFGLPMVVSNTGHFKGFVNRAETNGVLVDIAQPFNALTGDKIAQVSANPPAASVEVLRDAIRQIMDNHDSYRAAALHNAYADSDDEDRLVEKYIKIMNDVSTRTNAYSDKVSVQ